MTKVRIVDIDKIDVGGLVRLLTVVERGSINGSAPLMNTTQPTLARRIRRLEAALGHDILQRSADGVSLTPFGREVISHTRDIEESLGFILRAAKKTDHCVDQEIRVGVTQLAAIYVLPDVVRIFAPQGRTVVLRIVEEQHFDLLTALRAAELDIVIATPPSKGKERDLEFRPMTVVHFAIVANASHPILERRPIIAADLEATKWALPCPDPVFQQRVDVEFARQRLPPLVRPLVMPSPSSLLRLVRETDNLTVLPVELIQSELRAGGLAIVKGPWGFGPHPYGIYMKRSGAPNPMFEQFIHSIEQVLCHMELLHPKV